MNLDADDLLAILAKHAKRAERPVPAVHDELVDALREADRRSGDVPADEPAALFFALARRSSAYAGLAGDFTIEATHVVAEGNALELGCDDWMLALYRTRILRGMMSWLELRAAFAEHVRPIGASEIEPSKRPP